MSDYSMLIDGEWIAQRDKNQVVNPANEDVIATVPIATAANVDFAIEAAARSQASWSRLAPVARGDILRRWSGLVESHKQRLAQIISLEEGKPIAEALGEIDFGNEWLKYYAGFDRRIEGEILPPDNSDEQMWIIPAPVGVVVGIIPWNYPSALMIRKVAPALITGNSIVLKPHEDTPLSALEMAKLAVEAGVPAGVLNVLTGPGQTVGEALVKHPIPRLITFTGSVDTGMRIASLAAKTAKLLSLEMGGKAPFIVMEDCDLDIAADAAMASRFLNCGQVCICNERTYVHQDIAGRFTAKLIERVGKIVVGDPLDKQTTLGPKVNQAELDKVEQAVASAKSQGANIAVGGNRLASGSYQRGYWHEPTIITDVSQDMEIMQREIFGPVLPVMPFSNFNEVLGHANDSRFGLAAYVFTNDMNRMFRAIRDLDCGEIYINRGPGESVHGFHSGWKQSGIGGDDGKYGLEHYLRRKTVYLKYRDAI